MPSNSRHRSEFASLLNSSAPLASIGRKEEFLDSDVTVSIFFNLVNIAV
jgi:hypothetical protein